MQTSYFMYMYIAEESSHQITIFGHLWEGLNLPLIRNFKDLSACGCSPVNLTSFKIVSTYDITENSVNNLAQKFNCN